MCAATVSSGSTVWRPRARAHQRALLRLCRVAAFHQGPLFVLSVRLFSLSLSLSLSFWSSSFSFFLIAPACWHSSSVPDRSAAKGALPKNSVVVGGGFDGTRWFFFFTFPCSRRLGHPSSNGLLGCFTEFFFLARQLGLGPVPAFDAVLFFWCLFLLFSRVTVEREREKTIAVEEVEYPAL